MLEKNWEHSVYKCKCKR